MTSVSEQKLPEMKYIVVANRCMLRRSAATDLRGAVSFNSSFLYRSFLNLTVKRYEKWSTIAEVIVKIKLTYFLRRG